MARLSGSEDHVVAKGSLDDLPEDGTIRERFARAYNTAADQGLNGILSAWDDEDGMLPFLVAAHGQDKVVEIIIQLDIDAIIGA